jgi:hypothetical protein
MMEQQKSKITSSYSYPPSLQDFFYTSIGTLVSIPLSRIAPKGHRYTPLLVLGSIGGLSDFYATEGRIAKLKQEQQQQQQQQ